MCFVWTTVDQRLGRSGRPQPLARAGWIELVTATEVIVGMVWHVAFRMEFSRVEIPGEIAGSEIRRVELARSS
jgi:hypothetical protein